MPPTDPTLRAWWPSTQTIDLVEGAIEDVAAAIAVELSRFFGTENLTTRWDRFENLDAAFRSARCFNLTPTYFLVLPTKSKWCALWNNSARCDGYYALCYCLTKHHQLRTLHWTSHDQTTTETAGSAFIHSEPDGAEGKLRSVYCAQDDKRWTFFEKGDPLPEENHLAYSERLKRNRLNESLMTSFLNRLGARPWSEDFYDLEARDVFVASRINLAPKLAEPMVNADLPSFGDRT